MQGDNQKTEKLRVKQKKLEGFRTREVYEKTVLFLQFLPTYHPKDASLILFYVIQLAKQIWNHLKCRRRSRSQKVKQAREPDSKPYQAISISQKMKDWEMNS